MQELDDGEAKDCGQPRKGKPYSGLKKTIFWIKNESPRR